MLNLSVEAVDRDRIIQAWPAIDSGKSFLSTISKVSLRLPPPVATDGLNAVAYSDAVKFLEMSVNYCYLYYITTSIAKLEIRGSSLDCDEFMKKKT